MVKPKLIPHITGQALDKDGKPIPFYPIRIHADGGGYLADVMTGAQGNWVWQDEYVECTYNLWGPDATVEITIDHIFPEQVFDQHLYVPFHPFEKEEQAKQAGVEKGQCYACKFGAPFMQDSRGNHRHYLPELEEKLQWGYPKPEKKLSSKRSSLSTPPVDKQEDVMPTIS